MSKKNMLFIMQPLANKQIVQVSLLQTAYCN